MHQNTAAYALVSLDAPEVAAFEAHLATCEFCQREVAEFCEIAAELSLLTETTPPRRLRGRVLSVTETLAQLPPEGTLNGQVSPPMPAVRPMESGARPTGPRRAMPGWEIPDEPDSPAVDELALRRQRRRSRILSGVAAAMLIVAVGLGGVVYTLAQQVQQRDAAIAQRFREEQVVRAEDAKVIVAPAAVGGRCNMVVSKKMNRAVYFGTNMPDPGPGKQYQLWIGTGTDQNRTYVLDNPVPNTRPWRQVFRGNIAGADVLAVSIEAQGSAPTTPTEIVAVAPLRT
jgi:anti-sigma factor RsiW